MPADKRRAKPSIQREPPPGEIAVGRAVGAWGLQGHIKVEPMTDFADRFAVGSRLRLGGADRRIVDVKERKKQLLLKLDGIENPESAAALSGAFLTIPESELAPLSDDQYYRFQLLGLEVADMAGRDLGRVTDVLDTGETQVIVVTDGKGELLIPLISDFVVRIDLEANKLHADLTNLRE
ncbi:MAG TPA: ribosome maturation factor RimM [Dehalococcoidia bacterium]|nr:ribosome maturation factor RimM [Dehalococcoidia bacterium]